MDKVGGASAKGGGKQPGVEPVLQSGVTFSHTVRFLIVGDGICGYESSLGHPRGVPSSDHGESGEEAGIWFMGEISII